MSKKIIIFIFLGIVLFFIEWGNELMPTRLEISDAQVTELIGLDNAENDEVSLSVVFEQISDGNGKEKGGESSQKEKNLVITSKSFPNNLRGLQNYHDKIFIGSHINSIVIGEDMAKNNIINGIEFVCKNNEIRSNSKVYIAKEMTASQLFEESIGGDYSIASRINKIDITSRGVKSGRELDLFDILNIFLEEEKIGVIPCIQTVKSGDKQLSDYVIFTSNKDAKRIELAGYGVFKDAKLVKYLNEDESDGYDYINNFITEKAIPIEYEGTKYGINLIESNCKIKFDFENKKLTKIKIKVDTKNYISEDSTGENIFNGKVEKIQELENIAIKDKIASAVNFAKNEKIDFIGVGKQLKFRHPYRWREIKDNWKEIFPIIPVEIEVNSKIDREYDVLSILNKE